MSKITITRREIESDIKDILLEVIVTLNEKDIRPEAKLAEDFGADSLDIVEITMHAEKTFGINVTYYQMDEIRSYTVEQLCDMVEQMTK